jgi:hypothetical protein
MHNDMSKDRLLRKMRLLKFLPGNHRKSLIRICDALWVLENQRVPVTILDTERAGHSDWPRPWVDMQGRVNTVDPKVEDDEAGPLVLGSYWKL